MALSLHLESRDILKISDFDSLVHHDHLQLEDKLSENCLATLPLIVHFFLFMQTIFCYLAAILRQLIAVMIYPSTVLCIFV